MLFSLRELVQWLGFATFELFLHLLALLVFSMLVALRVDMFTPRLSWWLVFVPLFAADGLSTYFTAIVSIRLYQENEKRLAVLRLLWVLTVLSLKLVCEVLLCQKLAEQEQAKDLWFGLIVSQTAIHTYGQFRPLGCCEAMVLSAALLVFLFSSCLAAPY
uniref:Transmembrane protein 203 n=1 Tax=Amphilophus citrinellus TaxID=61819 RepID=A0A3Q0T252_AMPCI